MKDFPAFITEYGAASLILREIPYQGIAYIHLRDTLEPKKLLAECISFCRACGAEKIYAAGEALNDEMLSYPLHTEIWEMTGSVQPGGDRFRLVENTTVSTWRELYRRTMTGVDNAATLESRDEKRLLEEGKAGFVRNDGGECLGIVWINDSELLALAAVQPHCGERTLRGAVDRETRLTLEVASTNTRALALYKRMGFQKTAIRSRWYTVFEKRNPLSRKNT